MKRAYASEPVLLIQSPVTNDLKPAVKRRRLSRLWISAIVVVLAAGCLSWFLAKRPNNLVPPSIVQSAGFPVYYPKWLPDDYVIDRQSFDATPQVVTFTVVRGGDRKLIVTEQPLPEKSQLDSFYSQQLIESRHFTSAAGVVTTGQFEGSQFAGVATNQTWILIRAVAPMERSQLEQIARHLVQTK